MKIEPANEVQEVLERRLETQAQARRAFDPTAPQITKHLPATIEGHARAAAIASSPETGTKPWRAVK